MIELACVTGRFQPVHLQHVELFQLALSNCKHLIVAITNPDPRAHHQETSSAHRHTASANPLSYYQRVRLLETVFESLSVRGKVTMVPFDLTRPQLWRHYVPPGTQHYVRVYSAWERQKSELLKAHGYPVVTIDGDLQGRISAGDIRKAIRRGEIDWRDTVPATIAAMLPEMMTSASDLDPS